MLRYLLDKNGKDSCNHEDTEDYILHTLLRTRALVDRETDK